MGSKFYSAYLKTKVRQHKPNFFSFLWFCLKSSAREARQNKLYFFLAVACTLIVVAATAVSQTVINFTPLIFLKLSESSVGSTDVSIAPRRLTFIDDDGLNKQWVTRNLLLNSTAIKSQVAPIFAQDMTSRYSISCTVKKLDNPKTCNNLTATPYSNCLSFTGRFILQNTEQEANIGMGNNLGLPPLISYEGIIISEKLALTAGLKLGEIVVLRIDTTEILREVCIKYNLNQTRRSRRIDTRRIVGAIAYIPFKIEGIIGSMLGKLPKNGESDVILSEYRYFFTLLAQNMPNMTIRTSSNYPAFVSFLKKEIPDHYARSVFFNMEDRQETYINSNFDNIQKKVTQYASDISDTLGVFPYSMNLPVYKDLSNLKYAGLFLGIVLNIIVVILFLLSVILIYNLLSITVKNKTSEFGILRMVGLTKMGVAQLILAQAISFVIPGIILGLVISFPLLVYTGGKLKEMMYADIPMFPTIDALVSSILLGLLIPLISSYYPLKEALGSTLNQSLDQNHSKTSAVKVIIETDSKKFPTIQITFGALSVFFAISIYILLPLSLLSFNVALLLVLFFAILMGLFIGLTFLLLNIQLLIARLTTAIFFFWASSPFRTLIMKNLAVHKLRNKQTAIMYSLALGFIIFIVVTLRQELYNMAYEVEAEKGALFELKVTDDILDYKMLENTITTNLTDVVDNYAWITYDLVEIAKLNGYQDVRVTHKGHLYKVNPAIRGVSPSILRTTLQEFLVVDESYQESALDIGEQLYTPRGIQSAIVGTAYKDQLGLSLDIDSSILIILENGTNTQVEELRILATLDSAGGFLFSKIPSVENQDILVSLPTFRRLLGTMISTVDEMPIERLLIKPKNENAETIDKIFSQFNQLKQSEYPALEIWDFRDNREALQTNQDAISFIFVSIEIVVMILSIFSLVTSMSTNIMEQSKEIAVLRAIGLTKFKINLLFVSEAFVLVFSSALLGLLIGTAVAWTLGLQRSLFTELPLIFNFPTNDFGVILIAAIVSAFLSSYLPAHRITRLQISKILRRVG